MRQRLEGGLHVLRLQEALVQLAHEVYPESPKRRFQEGWVEKGVQVLPLLHLAPNKVTSVCVGV